MSLLGGKLADSGNGWKEVRNLKGPVLCRKTRANAALPQVCFPPCLQVSRGFCAVVLIGRPPSQFGKIAHRILPVS